MDRVLIGKRGTSDFGLFVSRSGQDVKSSTEPLGFDSRAAESLIVSSVAQGILVPNVLTTSGTQVSRSYNGTTYNQHTATVTHNLGFIPAYALRWCTFNQITSGLATETYPPFHYYNEVPEITETDQEEEGDEITYPGSSGETGLLVTNTTTSAISFKNMVIQDHDDIVDSLKDNNVDNNAFYFWSIVIFTAENFLNGESL